MSFFAGTFTLRTGLSDNPALATASTADSSTHKAPEYTLLDSTYLSGTITFGTPTGLGAGLTASTVTLRAIFDTRYIYLPLTTKGGVLQRNGDRTAEVGTARWRLASSRSTPTEEGVKNITKATQITEVEALKTPAKKAVSAAVTKAVVISALFMVGEHFVSFI
jgi:hypothetical protein